MPGMKRGRPSGESLKSFASFEVGDYCLDLAWSPDGRRVAAFGSTGPIVLFDIASGQIASTWPGHKHGTTAIAWEPNGARLTSVGQDGTVRFWTPGTTEPVLERPCGSGWAERLAWSGDGAYLATAAGKVVRVWSPSGEMVAEYPQHGSTVADLAWRPRQHHLAVAAYGGVVIYDIPKSEPLRNLDWKGSPLKLAWSPQGTILAHGNQDATVHFWYITRAEPLQMSGYPTKVRELSWDQTGRYLATGGSAAVCLWDCGGSGPEGTKPQMLVEEDDEKPLNAIAWQHRGYLLAAGGQDSTLRVWQPANRKGPLVGQDDYAEVEITTLAWSPDDKLLAVGTDIGAIDVYRIGRK